MLAMQERRHAAMPRQARAALRRASRGRRAPRRRRGACCGTSGVNKNSGRTKTTNQIAVSGPTARSPSRAAGIEPEQRRHPEQRLAGLRIADQEAEHEEQAHKPADIADRPAGAGEPPEPLRRHERRHHRVVEDGRRTRRRSRRSHKPTSTSGMVHGIARLAEPQAAIAPTTMSTPNAAIHGLRRPDASAIAPRIGDAERDRRARPPRSRSPTAPAPATGSGAIALAKYGA